MKLRCNYCKEYVDRDEALRVGLVSFCDEKCRQAKRTKTQASSAKAARRRKRSDRAFPEGLKELVHAADHYKCRACGVSGKYLHCHHILYRGDPGSTHTMGNLVSLCEDCHTPIIHADKKRFQPLLKKLVLLRENGDDYGLTVYDLEVKHEKVSGSIWSDTIVSPND